MGSLIHTTGTLSLLSLTLTFLLCACRTEDTAPPPTSQPASAPSLARQAASWSRDEACAKLTDDAFTTAAAARLVQLSDVPTLCVPDELTDDLLAPLRAVPLATGLWALGFAHPDDDTRLLAPVLVADTGDITRLDENLGEETLVLHLAENPNVVPHLAVQPQRICTVGDEVTPAIVLQSRRHVRFQLRQQHGFNYIALVLITDPTGDEVARYRWDPFEEAFLGPAADALPDPPGGKFRIDLDASPLLVPMGGEIPEPIPVEPPPDQPPRHDPGDEFA
jgi:hypothetical protein